MSSHSQNPDTPVLPLAGFAERLLGVIDEGRRTATYKLALLLAMIDSCAESATTTGEAPDRLGTRAIALHVAGLYWPQLRPFPTPAGIVHLRQITNKSATILTALRPLREQLGGVGRWEQAEALAPVAAAKALDAVEVTVARYPIVRLQTIDGVAQPFLYDVDWGETVTLRQLRGPDGGTVRLRPGAGDQLVRLAPLVRPLVELHWVRMVAALNALTPVEDDLRHHLFGAERIAFPALLRRGLIELQQDACFYCAHSLSASPTAVDHFVPWSRWPNDAIENLVAAHATCNTHKSDRIPGPGPLSRWVERLNGQAAGLAEIAGRAPWPTNRQRTVSLARSLYGHLPDGAPLWDGPQLITPAHSSALLDLLAPL